MLGDNIRKYRKLNNMSQDELAEKLEVTRQSISLWETGQTQPSLENIIALSKLFGVSTDELLAADNVEAPSANAVTPPRQEEPRRKNKPFLLISCIAVAVVVIALAVIAVVLLGNNGGGNNGNAVTTELPAVTEGSDAQSTVAEQTPTVDPEEGESSVKTEGTDLQSTVAEQTPTVDPEEDEKDIFGYLKNFVIQNGRINGDYCYYSNPADLYGGYASEDFSLYYWGDTNKIEFCLHSVIDETFSFNFYIYVPEEHSGSYEYVTSYYYRDNGESLYEAKGTIDAAEFTNKYPLNCTRYIGSTEKQNDFMEMSRLGICDLLECLRNFIEVEGLEYSFEELGFLKF